MEAWAGIDREEQVGRVVSHWPGFRPLKYPLAIERCFLLGLAVRDGRIEDPVAEYELTTERGCLDRLLLEAFRDQPLSFSFGKGSGGCRLVFEIPFAVSPNRLGLVFRIFKTVYQIAEIELHLIVRPVLQVGHQAAAQ